MHLAHHILFIITSSCSSTSARGMGAELGGSKIATTCRLPQPQVVFQLFG
jgi:hypothetical protein